MKEKLQLVPEELRGLFPQLTQVARYTRIYYEGIFCDNVGNHTLRCIAIADSLDIPNEDGDIIKKILWWHDVPEIMTTDYANVQKAADPELERRLEQQELPAVRVLIPERYRAHYQDFTEASRFWKGRGYAQLPTPHALVAKTVDEVDNNTFFHQSLARWVSSDSYNQAHLPQESALRYSFNSYRKFLERLESPTKPFGNFEQTIIDLLNYEITQICASWSGFEVTQMPEVVRQEILDILN